MPRFILKIIGLVQTCTLFLSPVHAEAFCIHFVNAGPRNPSLFFTEALATASPSPSDLGNGRFLGVQIPRSIAALEDQKLLPPTKSDDTLRWENKADGFFESLSGTDRALLERILDNPENLDSLIRQNPGKVYIKSYEQDTEEGRTVYLELDPHADRAVTVLRIKGSRALTQDGEANPYLGGSGYVSAEWKSEEDGTIKAETSSPAPRGGMIADHAQVEYETMILGSQAPGVQVDRALAWGRFTNRSLNGQALGFVIAGMTQSDKRLRVSLKPSAKRHLVSIRDEKTGHLAELSPEAGGLFINKTALLMRSWHKAGLFHGYPHADNIGALLNADGTYDPIFRDLNNTVTRQSHDRIISSAKEATLRFIDLMHPLTDLLFGPNTRLTLPFIKTYLGEELNKDSVIDGIWRELRRGAWLFKMWGVLEMVKPSYSVSSLEEPAHDWWQLLRDLTLVDRKLSGIPRAA